MRRIIKCGLWTPSQSQGARATQAWMPRECTEAAEQQQDATLAIAGSANGFMVCVTHFKGSHTKSW